MKVKELIEQLQKCEPENDVLISMSANYPQASEVLWIKEISNRVIENEYVESAVYYKRRNWFGLFASKSKN